MMHRPQSNHADGGAYEAADKAVGCCQMCLLVVLVAAALVAAGFSVATLASCHFLTYKQHAENRFIFEGADAIMHLPNNTNFSAVSKIDVGLYRWSIEGQGCQLYDSELNPPDAFFRVARIGGLAGGIGAVGGLALLAVETICCRFICGRFIACILLLLGVIGQACTFCMYFTEVCVIRGHLIYPCAWNVGSLLSAIATVAALVASILSCPAGKPKPLIRSLIEKDYQKGTNDPCCYCCREKGEKDGSKSTTVDNQHSVAAEPGQASAPPIAATTVAATTFADDQSHYSRHSHFARQETPYATTTREYQPIFREEGHLPFQQHPQHQQQPYYNELYYSAGNRPYDFPPTEDRYPGEVITTAPYRPYGAPPPPPPQPRKYVISRPPPPVSSFANAEIHDEDLFFDTHSV